MHNFKLYTIFIGLTVIIMAMCDTLIFKVISVGGYDFAASGIIYSFSFFIASIMTEVYGFNLAGRVVWVQLLCHVLFVLTINLFVLIPSPPESLTAQQYFVLYQNIWHVLIGSCIAMPTAYFINDLIVSKLKIFLNGRVFIIRFIASNIIGSAVLVSISYPVNFYHQYTMHQIALIAYHTWAYKVCIAMILMPTGIWISKLIKKYEKLDYYDYGTSYNPFYVFSHLSTGINKYGR